jgi:hypothetical protein
MPLIRSPRFRYTLRALLVCVTLFCLWGGYHANRAIKERRAEQILQQAHATLNYGAKRTILGRAGEVYQILVERVWREPNITRVSIHPNLTQSEADALVSLPHLQLLWINRSSNATPDGRPKPGGLNGGPFVPVRPGALPQVLSTHELWWLTVKRCVLDDADFRAISEHRSLEVLELMTNGTGEAVPAILSLPRLRVVRLTGGTFRDSGQGLPTGAAQLEEFLCSDWQGSGAGAEGLGSFLAGCPKLRSLWMAGDAVDDDFLRCLEGHPALEELVISGNLTENLTDDCIATIAKIPRLHLVDLPRRLVTPANVARLTTANPTIRVAWQGDE